ncbi:methionine--tRNA ligase [Candidatus Chazhemtobacterium aquaticus]|nr:methionine--tRNA ligase [Candidatus Chazhemtobacterium aquaticus]
MRRMKRGYYISTTLPYVNAEPHIGFALEIVRADVLARYHRLLGERVFFNTGTDEHGQKIFQMALARKMDPQKYVDEYAGKFELLRSALNLSYDKFIRTTDQHHRMAAQEFWRRVEENGYIYKKNYRVKYCVGCELEKQDSELENGRCPIHPNKELEVIEEENYFFKFSAFQERLLSLYKERGEFVVPANRLKEIRNFVEGGLSDFSISRVREKMPWGVPVPGDDSQVMYVWFDALVNYVSTLGWPDDLENYSQWWPGFQIAGKDNLRQQAAMWQAMLMAADLDNSKQILINGFITSQGQKISKSLGNVVNPIEYTDKYGTDAVRYFLLAKINPFDDSDFTQERFEENYMNDLANGLGNLIARTMAMCDGLEIKIDEDKILKWEGRNDLITKALDGYEFDKAINIIWDEVRQTNALINQKEIWKLSGRDKNFALEEIVLRIRNIGVSLQPFMPETAEKIMKIFGNKQVVKGEQLFPRLKS